MAVYTRFSEQELDLFLDYYTLGGCKRLQEIQQGVENSNYFLWTSNNCQYVLTIYEKRVNEADLPYFLDFTTFLKNKGINAPSAIKNKQGQFITDFVGKKAAIISFLEGNNLDSPNAQQCYSAGQLVAQLHLAQEGFTGYRFNTLSPSSKDLRQLYDSMQEILKKELFDIDNVAQKAFELIEKDYPKDIPLGNIHADIFPDNMFFIGNDAVGVIDFYFACHDFLAYDLAIVLCAWCFNGGIFIPDNYENMIQGYSHIRSLTESEIYYLITLMKGAALRFMLTRAYDWLHTPKSALVTPKNPYEFKKIYDFLSDDESQKILMTSLKKKRNLL
jgi:homoserine kinase type II